MLNNFLVKGFLIGFTIGVPVGVIGALTIQRILANGPIHGLISGLGSCMGDLLYGCIAAFGLTFMSNFLIKYQTQLRLLGGTFVLLLGLKLIISKQPKYSAPININSAIKTFVSSFILSVTNPTTILSFLVIFSSYGLSGNINYINAIELVTGVFLGSGIWWIILIIIISSFKKKINDSFLKKLNEVFGVIIILISLFIFISS
ncbi:LysE family transporter [Clostridium sp. SHJSY1]|uniref:LysE family translocator n=1 Tax=Clostridium sp. SHJSY1 TaxID=2942483 RepID=UPI0028768748|nr:LysE family transporter [Clostridium sp. SHJSY1]MDS0527897.1 LysE family transporter [Clostridium sp. SHJSY1]